MNVEREMREYEVVYQYEIQGRRKEKTLEVSMETM